jgi:hypothetical protein
MKFLLIQVILNALIFRMASDKFLKIYRIGAYLIYPILIAILIVFPEEGIMLNEHNGTYGFSLDISVLVTIYFASVILLSIIVQYIFNNWAYKILRKNS